jgi:hypothetical protein
MGLKESWWRIYWLREYSDFGDSKEQQQNMRGICSYFGIYSGNICVLCLVKGEKEKEQNMGCGRSFLRFR